MDHGEKAHSGDSRHSVAFERLVEDKSQVLAGLDRETVVSERFIEMAAVERETYLRQAPPGQSNAVSLSKPS